MTVIIFINDIMMTVVMLPAGIEIVMIPRVDPTLIVLLDNGF